VEQQRRVGETAPSLYDLRTCSRSTWRRGGTCGRWSTCCTPTVGPQRPGEAEALLQRNSVTRLAAHSGHSTGTPDWLSFFMFH